MCVGDAFLEPLSLTFSCSVIEVKFRIPPGTLENDVVECEDDTILVSLVVEPETEDGVP